MRHLKKMGVITMGVVILLATVGDTAAQTSSDLELTGSRILVSPAAIDFGDVELGATTSTLVVARNTGTTPLLVLMSDLSADAEYAVEGPTGGFSIMPGDQAQWTIRYAPSDEGSDTGSFTVYSDDPQLPAATVELAAAGFVAVVNPVDLDIAQLRVDKRVDLGRNPEVGIVVVVKNACQVSGESRPATLQAVQNGQVVYTETQQVYDDVGRGRTRFHFGPFVPTGPGDLEWTLQIDDDDVDVDLETAATRVVGGGSSAGASGVGEEYSGAAASGAEDSSFGRVKSRYDGN